MTGIVKPVKVFFMKQETYQVKRPDNYFNRCIKNQSQNG